MTAPLRKASEFLRVKAGVTERQCLDCRRWYPQDREHYRNQRRVLPGKGEHTQYDSRCRKCSTTHRGMALRGELQFGSIELPPPVSRTPPPMPTLLQLIGFEE